MDTFIVYRKQRQSSGYFCHKDFALISLHYIMNKWRV